MKKIAVITGASDGLGLAIAKKLKLNGYTIIAVSRTEPKDLNYDKWLAWDLSKPELLTSELMEEQIGSDVSVFVANAGILKGIPPHKYTYEDIRYIQDIHINSHVLLANYLAERMKKKQEGRTVFIGFLLGKDGPNLARRDACVNATKKDAERGVFRRGSRGDLPALRSAA